MSKYLLFIALVFFGSASVQAQTPSASPSSASNPIDLGIKPNLAAGEVSAVDQAGSKIVLLTKDGAIDVTLSSATLYKRISPEKINLAAATEASLTDISVGDKILVTGAVATDKKSVPAKAIYLIRKDDIARKNQQEREAWKTRGINGKVTNVNLLSKEITISVSGGVGGERAVVVKPKEAITYRRYTPDSIKFSDAQVGSLSEIKVGDRVRALGDRSADGASFVAEEVVSGSFAMVGGTITAIDQAKNEISIKELGTNKPVTISVKETTVLKKFPAEMASMMATRMSGGAMQPPGGGAGGTVTVRPPQGNQPTGQGNPTPPNGAGPGGGARAVRGEFDDLLERFPATSLNELKVGDAIAISSTTGATPNRYTAIKLLSGVEPFFQAQQAAASTRGSAQSPSLNIPGLDGGIGGP